MKRHPIHLTGILILLAALPLRAENWTKFTSQPDANNIRIEGTSTLHDWAVEGTIIRGFYEVEQNSFSALLGGERSNSTAPKVRAHVRAEIPVRSLKSNKKGMDKRMYKALKAEKHAAISYRLQEARVKDRGSRTDADASVSVLATRGELTIAGVSRTLEMHVKMERIEEKNLRFTGEIPLKMTDFGVKPPKAMLGAIRTGDEIKIYFTWTTRMDRRTALWLSSLTRLQN